MRELIEPMSTMRPPLPAAIIARGAIHLHAADARGDEADVLDDTSAQSHQKKSAKVVAERGVDGIVVDKVTRVVEDDPAARHRLHSLYDVRAVPPEDRCSGVDHPMRELPKRLGLTRPPYTHERGRHQLQLRHGRLLRHAAHGALVDADKTRHLDVKMAGRHQDLDRVSLEH